MSFFPPDGTEPDWRFQPNGSTRARFYTTGISLATWHAIKRACESEVPSLAITQLLHFECSALGNKDMLAATLGQITIDSSSVDTYLYPGECRCVDFCQRCAAAVALDVSLPASSRDALREVTSDDLAVVDLTRVPGFPSIGEEGLLQDKTMIQNRLECPIRVVVPGRHDTFTNGEDGKRGGDTGPIPITRLAPGQAIRFYGLIRKGKASKGPGGGGKLFQASATFGIRDLLDITIDRSVESRLTPPMRMAVAIACPQQVFDLEDWTDEVDVRSHSASATAIATATATTKAPAVLVSASPPPKRTES
jgi:hypothetical protein